MIVFPVWPDIVLAKYRIVQRDKMNREILKTMGWKVVIIWECEIVGKELGELQGGYWGEIEYMII